MKRSKLIFCAVSAVSVFTVAITLSSASLAADVAAEPVPEESYDLGLPFDPEIDLDVDVFRIGVNFNF